MSEKADLRTVHAAFATWCMEALGARDPESNRSLLTAAEASVIRAFLKDNDITQPPVAGTAIHALREKLKQSGRMPVNPALDLGEADGLMQ